MKKILFLSLTIFIFNSGYAQKRTDIAFIFKTQLFLELSNPVNSNINKDYKVFNNFINQTSIKFDTLKSNIFGNEILFVKIKPGNLKLNSKFLVADNCNSYIMAVDTLTGISYKLEGFYNNEFLFFFEYVKGMRHDIETIKDFTKIYNLDDIDFQCLYDAAKNKKYDPLKYPCSKRCSDLISIY